MYGVRGIAFDLFKTYLYNKKHYSVVTGITFGTENLIWGVPKCSTLGPLLFLSYINDLSSATKCKLNLFADNINRMSDNNAKKEKRKKETAIINELKNMYN